MIDPYEWYYNPESEALERRELPPPDGKCMKVPSATEEDREKLWRAVMDYARSGTGEKPE